MAPSAAQCLGLGRLLARGPCLGLNRQLHGGLPVHARQCRMKSSAAGSARLHGTSDVAAAVEACCTLLGRASGPDEAALAERLRTNWYFTAADVARMSPAEAASLQVPARLLHQLNQMLSPSLEVTILSGDGSPAQTVELPACANLRAATSIVEEVLWLGTSEQRSTAGPRPGSSKKRRAQRADSLESTSMGAAAAASVLLDVVVPADCGGKSAAEPGAAGMLSSSAALRPAPPPLHPDEDAGGSKPIMDRKMPATQRFRFGSASAVKVTKRATFARYRLQEEEMSPTLRAEFEAFHTFSTTRFYGQLSPPIAPITARKYADHLRGMLGWLVRVQGQPPTELSFAAMLPTHERGGVALAFTYIQWLQAERGTGVRTEALVLRSLMQAAKFVFHARAAAQPDEGHRPYTDLYVVRELRKMAQDAAKAARSAPRAADDELKWLTWPQYLQLRRMASCGMQVVRELRRECAGKDKVGRCRTPSAIAWSLQRYLVFAILSCIPDRQRTLRELQHGRTLVKKEERWLICHAAADYKTGRAYGDRAPLVIAPHIYPELEAYLNTWRAVLAPQHPYVFCAPGGRPLTVTGLYRMFTAAAFRLAGKKTNPHLVRDMIVTHLRGTGASERELEALAIYMGHSLDMQRSTYDRRTKAAKVEPAVDLLEALNRGALANHVRL